jgi:hypothetical protein
LSLRSSACVTDLSLAHAIPSAATGPGVMVRRGCSWSRMVSADVDGTAATDLDERGRPEWDDDRAAGAAFPLRSRSVAVLPAER